MKMKLLVSMLFCFLSVPAVLGQVVLGHTLVDPNGNPFLEGKILLSDETIEQGFIQLPLKSSGNSVGFKKEKNSDEKQIEKDKIKKIIVKASDGRYNVVENLRSYHAYTINTPELNEKYITSKSFLLLQVVNGPVKMYVKGDNLVVNKDGSVDILSIGYSNAFAGDANGAAFDYYIRREGDEVAILFFNTSWPKSKLKKICTTWFSDNKELMDKIEEEGFLKEIKKENLEKLVEIVNGSGNLPIGGTI